MGDVINLRQARKARARSDKAAVADANRARHGRTKAQKQADAINAARDATRLEGARRQRSEDDPEVSED